MDTERVNPADYSEHKPLKKWSETLYFPTPPVDQDPLDIVQISNTLVYFRNHDRILQLSRI